MPKRRSDEEQKKLYELWRQSGLTGMVFCKQNHISSHSLWRWKKRFDKAGINGGSDSSASSTNKDLKFYQVSKVKGKDEVGKSGFLELILPKGIGCKIHLSETSINNFLHELLK